MKYCTYLAKNWAAYCLLQMCVVLETNISPRSLFVCLSSVVFGFPADSVEGDLRFEVLRVITPLLQEPCSYGDQVWGREVFCSPAIRSVFCFSFFLRRFLVPPNCSDAGRLEGSVFQYLPSGQSGCSKTKPTLVKTG